MNAKGWLWIGAGAAVLLAFGRKQRGTWLLGSPVEGSGVLVVTPHGHFGASRSGPPAHDHQGVDLAARAGSNVLAVGDGQIVATDPGLGKLVRKLRLDVPGQWKLGGRRVDAIVYADLGRPLVAPGDRVRRGDPIALVDKAGFVHFAVKESRTGGEIFFDPREAGFTYRLTTPEVA
jgi:murein DD-endopeptidase MepM/ murein hydrolase activator NlpD